MQTSESEHWGHSDTLSPLSSGSALPKSPNAAQKLQHDKLRCEAARALGAIGAGAAEAIPALERCLEEAAIAGAAREAIGKIQA